MESKPDPEIFEPDDHGGGVPQGEKKPHHEAAESANKKPPSGHGDGETVKEKVDEKPSDKGTVGIYLCVCVRSYLSCTSAFVL